MTPSAKKLLAFAESVLRENSELVEIALNSPFFRRKLS